jgi:hypothetical protein
VTEDEMDYLLENAKQLADEVWQKSESDSEAEKLSEAIRSLIAYVAKKFNEESDEDDD